MHRHRLRFILFLSNHKLRLSRTGMGNFDSDEGQNFFLIYTKGPDY